MQHEATLGGKLIMNWAPVCAGIVKFIFYTNQAEPLLLEKFLGSMPDGENYSPEELLEEITLPGLTKSTNHYLKKCNSQWGKESPCRL
jgi:hypothetical protein